MVVLLVYQPLFTFVSYSNTHSDTELVFKHFATITHPNYIGKKQRLLEQGEEFFSRLAFETGCHIFLAVGAQYFPNPHLHAIVMVLANEEKRYRERVIRFNAHDKWKFRQRFDRWSNEKGGITGEFAFQYLAKHEIVLESEMIQTFCPKKYARCRRGACEFTAQT